MADFVITAAQVTVVSGQSKNGTAGATIAAGDTLYKDTADANKLKLADANGAGDLHDCAGVALNNAAAGQPVSYIDNGEVILTTGSALGVAGLPVVLSATAGKMAPHTDTAAGHFVNLLGFLDSTGKNLKLGISKSTLAHG